MTQRVTPETIKENYDFLEEISLKLFSKERHEKVLKIFEHFQDRMLITPASYREDYHNAFDGGWLLHTVNVVKNALTLYNVWEKENLINEFTISELTFAAIFHDWGKLGNIKHSFYIPRKSEWHRKRGMVYEFNPKLKGYMPAEIRAIYLLNNFGFKLTENEFLAIKLSNGMFEENNRPYYNNLISNLPIIIHHADHMAVRMERMNIDKQKKETTDTFKKALFSK